MDFNEVNQYLANGTLLPKPTAHERLNMLLRHFELLCKYKGTALGVREIRTHAAGILKACRSRLNGVIESIHYIRKQPLKRPLPRMLPN